MLSGEARAEIVAQRACMLNAMRSSLKGLKLALPAGDIVKSDVRPYGEQKDCPGAAGFLEDPSE
jgi:hypothetical protein